MVKGNKSDKEKKSYHFLMSATHGRGRNWGPLGPGRSSNGPCAGKGAELAAVQQQSGTNSCQAAARFSNVPDQVRRGRGGSGAKGAV